MMLLSQKIILSFLIFIGLSLIIIGLFFIFNPNQNRIIRKKDKTDKNPTIPKKKISK